MSCQEGGVKCGKCSLHRSRSDDKVPCHRGCLPFGLEGSGFCLPDHPMLSRDKIQCDVLSFSLLSELIVECTASVDHLVCHDDSLYASDAQSTRDGL
jgi:hypothetical protein